MGRETDGVSPAFLAAADKRVFIPMVGFAESFNLSVATALVVQKLFDICPEARGDISAERIAEMRRVWYAKLLAPTRLRDRVEEMLELASKPAGDGGDPALHMADLRRVTTRVGWNKKLKQRMLAADDAMGRGDVEAAVEAAKGVPKPDSEAAAKRARPTGNDA